MKEDLPDIFDRPIASCDPEKTPEEKGSTDYAEISKRNFYERFKNALEKYPIDDRGVLAGPVKRQELKLKPLKFNKSKARKLARMAKNKLEADST